jgi:exopolysaccharide biosynthesis protein
MLRIAKGLFNKIIDGTLKAGDVKSSNELILEIVIMNLVPDNILIIESVGTVSLNTRIWYAA